MREGNPEEEETGDFYSSLLEAAMEQFSPRSQQQEKGEADLEENVYNNYDEDDEWKGRQLDNNNVAHDQLVGVFFELAV